MKVIIATVLIFCSSLYGATPPQSRCDLPVFAMGNSVSTPLQKKVEGVLILKGFNVIHRSSAEFYSANLVDVKMFAISKAGLNRQNAATDCAVREFEDLGRFYTCRYELTLFFFSETTLQYEPVVKMNAATRDARSTDGFYQTIRDQLRELPMCLNLNLIKR